MRGSGARVGRWLRFVAVALVAAVCASGGDAAPRAARALVSYRPGESLAALGPDARVDRGLRAATEELAAAATTLDARLDPVATRLALARAGYPGDARFVLLRGGTEPPAALLDGIPRGAPVDVGWAFRDFPGDGGGTRLWVLGWAPRRVSLDPVPRDIARGEGLTVRVDGAADPRLFLGHPDGRVESFALTDGVGRFVDRFEQAGEHRVEVVDGDRVELLFSVFADAAPGAVRALRGPAPPAVPEVEVPALYAALDRLRAEAGLAPLARFAAFEPHARAHAACLASAGEVAHATPSCPGVPALAKRTHFPAARHHEDVAAGDAGADAWERVLASPGHVRNLLCADCTHVAIGATLEPGPASRLFVVWELLEFPEGEPVPIPAR